MEMTRFVAGTGEECQEQTPEFIIYISLIRLHHMEIRRHIVQNVMYATDHGHLYHTLRTKSPLSHLI